MTRRALATRDRVIPGTAVEMGQAAAPARARRADAAFVLNATPALLAAWQSSLIETPISRAEALQVPAVMRARNLIAGTIGTLPLVCRDADSVPLVRPLLEQPEAPTTRTVTISRLVSDLMFEGIGWWYVTEREWTGFPKRVRRLDPQVVAVDPSSDPFDLITSPEVPVPYGQARVAGVAIPDRDLIRFDSPLPPLLRHGARAIRTLLRLDAAASTYAESPMPLELFMPAEGADPADDDEIAQMLDDWAAARRTRSSAYLPAALKRETATPLTAEQIQLADSRQHAVLEIARLAGIDAEDLSVSTTSRTYANVQQRQLAFIQQTLAPYLHAIEDRLSMGDVTPRGQAVRFDLAELERADTLTRYQAYEVGERVGAITPEEIRQAEGRPQILEPATPSAPPAAPPAQQQEAGVTHAARAGGTFTAGTLVRFEAPTPGAEFRVNPQARTITGLVLPFGEVARSGYNKYRFAPGSLRFADPGRVKLLRDHNSGEALGVMTASSETDAGVVATFRVARGPAGDQALALAEDGVLDGFSVGVDFNDPAGVVPDPANEGVLLVTASRWVETSLTAIPSFDNARVSGVKATAQPEGTFTMQCSTCGTVHAVGAPCPTGATLTLPPASPPAPAPAPDAAAFQAAVTAAVEAALARFGAQGPTPTPQTHGGATPPAAPAVPLPRAVGFTVTEPPVYRFSRQSGNSLVRDLFRARTQGDREAVGRLEKFKAQQAEIASKVELGFETFEVEPGAAFTTATRSNVSQIIPPGYKPQYYVPQLFQGRPIIDSLSRGVLEDATSFAIPKFGTATGLSGTGTEGTNPTDGTITASTVTVTPATAVGLFKVTRELVDAANPAIDAIALQAMQEAYSQDVEGRAYAKINSAAGVAGVITSGFVPSGAAVATTTGAAAGLQDDGLAFVRALRLQLTQYGFRRFAPVTRALVSSEGATLLTSAEDSTGRPLLPPITPMNALGQSNLNDVSQMWSLDGLPVKGAWSMTGNTAGDPDSLLFNHNDVWCWESPLLMFRYEERSGPANIELAMFGYFAVEILRGLGFSAIRHTAIP